jgi:hypothetical protein
LSCPPSQLRNPKLSLLSQLKNKRAPTFIYCVVPVRYSTVKRGKRKVCNYAIVIDAFPEFFKLR